MKLELILLWRRCPREVVDNFSSVSLVLLCFSSVRLEVDLRKFSSFPIALLLVAVCNGVVLPSPPCFLLSGLLALASTATNASG